MLVQTPNTSLYPELEKKDGYLVTNEKQETNLPGVYAAGDICVKLVRQAATAVSDGAVAAIWAARVRQKPVIIIKKEAKRQAERKKDFFLLFLFWSAERMEAKNPSFIQKKS